jgi:lysozyme family protein
MNFENALPKILKEEGGYVNDPSDSGGATNRGITQATYDLYRDSKDLERRHVRFARMTETAEIYEQFWNRCGADKLPAGLNLSVFDFSVNAGPRRGVATLQHIVGTTPDGIIGSKTLAAVRRRDTRKLISEYAEARRDFYNSLASRRTKDKKFLRGWLLRTNRVEQASLKAADNEASTSDPAGTTTGE